MFDLTGQQAVTMHRLLEAIPGEDGRFVFRRDADCPLEAECLVLDETSMICSDLAYHFLQAVEEGTRVILVGDTDQLPPVGPGNFLRDLISSGVIPCAELTTIKRQNPGLIIRSCHEIRAGRPLPPDSHTITNLNGSLPAGDLVFVRRTDPLEIQSAILHLVTETLPKMGFNALRDVQILSPYREKTDLSCQALNALLQDHFTVPEPGRKLSFRTGDKVIQCRNDYELGLINGDVGFVQKIQRFGNSSIYTVHFDSPERVVDIPAGDNDLQLAYTITCHKFQGSELDVIIIPLHPVFGDWFVQRNWLYTAISRARKLCVLVGMEEEVKKIVKRNHQERRYTRLAELLRNG
jgi:exodeoxyribonuclease V alpha subunit